MTGEGDLQEWVSKRLREFEGRRISWTGEDGNPRHVKLELKEVELSAKPRAVVPGGGPPLEESATIRLTPALRLELEDEPDEIDLLASEIFAADAGGCSDDEIGQLWERLKRVVTSVFGDCNIIPGEPGALCFERLVVFPELVSLLARHHRLPGTLDYCGRELGQLTKRETGICCALCRATMHVQNCFSAKNRWRNHVVDVRGNYNRIRNAKDGDWPCPDLWRPLLSDPVVRARVENSSGKETEGGSELTDDGVRPISCWRLFVEAIRRLHHEPGAPSGKPLLLLSGRRVRL